MENQDTVQLENKQNQPQEEEDDEAIMIPITTLTKISNYVDRYFVRFYKVYKNELTNQCLNQYAFQHTNKLCMVGLASEHEIVAQKKKVTKISFEKVYSGDMQKLVRGKKKKGGIKSTPNKTIGEIFCEDGSIYEVKGVIDGNVIELNDNLLTNPTWITDYPDSKGYIAIINIGKKAKLQNRDVLNQDMYNQVLLGVDIETVKKQAAEAAAQDNMEEENKENDEDDNNDNPNEILDQD